MPWMWRHRVGGSFRGLIWNRFGGVMVSTVHGTRQCEHNTRTTGNFVKTLFARAKSAVSGFVADLLPGDSQRYTPALNFA